MPAVGGRHLGLSVVQPPVRCRGTASLLTASGCMFIHPGPLRQHPIMPPVGRRCGPCEGKAWALCVTGGRLFLHPPSSDRADERVFRTGTYAWFLDVTVGLG